VAYRAEIEIAIRGARQLKDLQNEIERTSKAVDQINEALNSVNDKTAVTFNSLSRTLSDARQAFDDAARGTSSFGAAIDTLIKTEREYNNELRERNSLLAQARAAQTAAARTISPGLTGFSAEKFGPQVPAGTGRQGDPAFASSPVAERLSQQLRDQARLKASLLALDEKSAAAAEERLRLSTQLKEELNDIKVAARTGPREPEGFSKAAGQENVRRKQIMQEGAAFVAQEEAKTKAAIEGHNKVAEFAKKNEATVFGIRAKNIRRTLELGINRVLEEARAKNKALDENFKKQKEIDKKTLADFNKRLNAEVKAKEQAAKDVRKAEKKIEDQAFKERQARRAKLKDAVGSGLIGGAFPLLFGQGGGAAIGGGIGGFAGGLAGGQMGFALSLVGTQIGAFVDQIVSGGATLGQALNPLTADIDALAEAAGFAGTETGKALKTIQELGSEQQALEAATALLAATVGNEGVEALRQFGSDTQELSNAFGRAMALMQTAAAQLFGGIAKLAAAAVSDAVDLQAGLTNINDPRLKKLREERADLQANDGEGAFVGEKTEANLRRISEINKEITEIVAANRIEVERTIQAEARRLQNAEILGQFGEKDAKLQKIKNSLAGVEKDFTDENFVSLQKQLIQRTKELNLDKAKVLVGKDENGQIRDNGLLAKLNSRINQIALNEEKDLNKEIEKAIEAKNKKIASGVKKTDRQNEQLLQQKQQATALTSALERQLAQSKVAGTVEAQKLAIEGRYEQTLERIAKLRDQSEASEQRKLAAQIKTNAEAKLAFDQEQKRAKALRDAVAPLKQIRDSQEANLTASREYNRLVMEGILPAEAKRITEFNKQVSLLLEQKTEAIQLVELDILRAKANGNNTTALEEQLDLLRKQQAAIKGEAAKGPGKGKSDKERIEDAIGDAQGKLNELIDPVNQVVAAAGAIGDAFSESFKGVISGSMSAQQALANLFQKTADHFLDMTAQIIAAAIKAQAIQFISSIIGSTASAGASASAGPSPLNLDGIQQYVDTSPVLTKSSFAEGGYVSRPTNALIGEGGEPEYVIPESKMRTAMSRYSRGSRGNSVISESGAVEATGGGGGTAVAAPIDVRYTVERINSVDYVTADQFQVGMQQAAQQGAKQGEQQTLKRLQMSGSTRKRIGI